MSDHQQAAQQQAEPRSLPGQLATGKRYIPDVPVVSHQGCGLSFYHDLIEGRVVVVNFMSIASDATYPVTANLAKVARLLGGRLGRDVHLYSVTTDPQRDTAEALARFANKHRAAPGWLFLTGEPAALQALQAAFFIHVSDHAPPAPARARRTAAGGPDAPNCSLGLLRYGNDAAGIWGSAPVRGDPAMLVERLDWIRPRPASARPGPLRRGGPRPPA